MTNKASPPPPFGYYYEYEPTFVWSKDENNTNNDGKNKQEEEVESIRKRIVLEHCHGCGMPPIAKLLEEQQQQEEEIINENNYKKTSTSTNKNKNGNTTETTTTTTTMNEEDNNNNGFFQYHQKLLACSKCHGAVYHDQNCQRRHWKPSLSSSASASSQQQQSSHKKVCQKNSIRFNELKKMWYFWKKKRRAQLVQEHIHNNNNNPILDDHTIIKNDITEYNEKNVFSTTESSSLVSLSSLSSSSSWIQSQIWGSQEEEEDDDDEQQHLLTTATATTNKKKKMNRTTFWKTLDKNWKIGIELWYQQDYLQAMAMFQQALQPWMKEWEQEITTTTTTTDSITSTLNNDDDDDDEIMSRLKPQNQQQQQQQQRLLSLAQRLLFCAYCEMDMDTPDMTIIGRQRLVACLGILLPLLQQQQQQQQYSQQQQQVSTTWDRELYQTLHDAWIELVLIYEEGQDMTNARHLAHWAIRCQQEQQQQQQAHIDSNTIQQYRFCDWTDPYQRPGYMAPTIMRVMTTTTTTSSPSSSLSSSSSSSSSIPVSLFFNGHCPRDQHPAWCQILEEQWKGIRDDYLELCQQQPNQLLFQKVGCGIRGSGEHDGSVVQSSQSGNSGHSGGKNSGEWTEYVLFGTGANKKEEEEEDNKIQYCQFTKQLLRNVLSSEAIDLAIQGGGEIILSRLAPHTHIQAHCGPTNLRWTAHLGLVVPSTSLSSSSSSSSINNPYKNQCHIRVRHDWYTWQPGKMLVFDDSYEHEVVNDTDWERVVLLIRFWNPLLLDSNNNNKSHHYDSGSPFRHRRDDYLLAARTKKEQAIDKRYHPPSSS